MNTRVNRIIEMAMDFAEFGVTDPHEPEFHKTMAGELVVVYYGTTTSHFWGVVRQGVESGPTIKRQVGERNDLSLDVTEAKDNAHRRAYQENNEQHDGPVKAIVFVLETKLEKPFKAGASDMDRFIAGTGVGSEVNSILPQKIKPTAITGVYHEEINWDNSWEIPIKKFIQMVNSGQVDGLEPDREFKRSHYRPGTPTPEAWQIVVLRHVSNLLNYSSNLFDYLVGSDNPVPYNDTIIREATKVGLPKMLNWTGKDFMEWVYTILPVPEGHDRPKEEDIDQVLDHVDIQGVPYGQAGKVPFYRIWRNLMGDSHLYRAGKKGPHSPGGGE